MITRDLASRLQRAVRTFPAVTVIGPRQSGKSTLCRMVLPDRAYTNLEAPDVRRFAQEDPRGFLAQFPDGAILDEIQRCPELPSYLQVMMERDPRRGRWILTGSQNLSLLASVSQSLAGRTAMLHLLPLSRGEACRFPKYPATLDATLLTGGYPRILDQDLNPPEWLEAYVATYIERDVRTVLNVADQLAFHRFVELCAGRTSQMLNLQSLASDCGIAQPTAKAWLAVLETTFIAFRLPAYTRSTAKRVVKTPKLHFYDTGLVCWLLGIRAVDQLRAHPLRGAIFETWVASEIYKQRLHRGDPPGLYYYRDAHGLEADLLIPTGNRPVLIETKSGATVAPDMLRPVRKVQAEIAGSGQPRTYLVYGGETLQPRSDVIVVPWLALHEQRW
jgi:predicted AAA+ superfamily ATPase